jgi:uncharacterized Zn finger protein (UPF0148 family)
MGAVEVYHTFPGHLSLAEVKAAFSKLQEDERWEHGADIYSGSIDKLQGYTIEHKTYPSVEAACESIFQRTDKHGPGILTKAYKSQEITITPNPILTKLRSEVGSKWDLERSLITEIMSEIKGAKSRTIGCKDCGSSLSRQHLAGYRCPVCQADLRSETQRKKFDTALQRYDQKVAKLRAEEERLRQQALKKLPPTEQIVWVVGGFVPY